MASAPPRTSHPHLLPFPQLSALHLAVTLAHHAPGARRLDSCGACGSDFQKIHLCSRFGTETLRHGHPRHPWTFCRSLGFVQGHGCRAWKASLASKQARCTNLKFRFHQRHMAAGIFYMGISCCLNSTDLYFTTLETSWSQNYLNSTTRRSEGDFFDSLASS